MKRINKQKEEYHANKIWPIIQVACRIVQNEPAILDDMPRFKAMLGISVPELKNHAKCAGCDRSMKVTVYEADLHDGLLILAMARVVRENINKGMNFTEANRVHIPTLGASQATLKRQTKCDYLGLVKQPDDWSGTGFWVLTSWAWKALRGDPIPRAAKYWEGHMLDRSEETITLDEMFQNHKHAVEMAIAKRKAVKTDYRAKFSDYDRKEWTEFLEFTPKQKRLL